MIHVLSIKQPWAYHIFNSGKTVENRTWRSSYRGPLAIHASRKPDGNERAWLLALNQDKIIPDEALYKGGIIGVVEMVNCIAVGDSPTLDIKVGKWWEGPFGFVFRNPRAIKPIRFSGKLGIRPLPDDIEEMVNARLGS